MGSVLWKLWFGFTIRLYYNWKPWNLAARLQSMAEIDDMLVDEKQKTLYQMK